MRYVTKRDGRTVDFDPTKITNAVFKAYQEVYGKERAFDFMSQIQGIVTAISLNMENLTVEEIQDLVEQKLMITDQTVAKSYLLYRNSRSKERDRNSKMIRGFRSRINTENNERSNANVDEGSFSGKEKEASTEISKLYALEYGGFGERFAKAHKSMLVYLHDLEKLVYGMHNCLNVNFQEIFAEGTGFETRNGDVRAPGSFESACQLVAVAFQCQSQVQFGGVGTIHLDYDLAPFAKKSFAKQYIDGLVDVEECMDEDSAKTYVKSIFKDPEKIHIDDPIFKEHPRAYKYAMKHLNKDGKQGAEALYHNLNTLESRQGSQVPFSSANLGRDTSPEGRLVIKWIFDASLAGVGKFKRTAIFPISIFQWKPGVNANQGDPNYDLKQLALKSMSKRIYPNWVNCNWSEAHEDPDDIDTMLATMGCRTLVGYDRHGLGYNRQGRGNNVPHTVILPKLGIEYGICQDIRETADLDGFWTALDNTLELTVESLLERYAIMASQSPGAAPFMYKNNTIKGARECVDNVHESLKHNSLAIGYIGIAEMCQALFGTNHVHNKEVHAFALSVVKHIHDYAATASDKYDLNFVCYATPAEGLCSTALKALRKQYGIIENVTSREYLTNSHHVPVWETVDPFQKLKLEAPFCKYPTGGCITYVELDSTFMNNLSAIEKIIDYAFSVLDIPYLAFNFPIDTCLECGYQGEIGDECPECHSSNINRLARVTGYLTTDVANFNDGKKAEVGDRVKHTHYLSIDELENLGK